MLQLERETRERLISTRPGFDPDVQGLWADEALVDGTRARDLTARDPELIGWLHVVEALSQGCIFTARYRAAASYARTVMRAEGYPNIAVGTLFLALARLEDEDAFFSAARDAGEEAEELPWFLLGRAILLYKVGQRRSARRALRDFATRCEGGAFFLINPCIFTARYRAAASYARTVMRAEGYPNIAVGTLFLALARLEYEDAFFSAARDAGDEAEVLPWCLLRRAMLLYKVGQRRSARRARRDFATRC